MKLRDLPQPIRELAEKRIREQGFKPYDNMIASWFDWEKSEEGNEFWSEVYKGNFAPFYERYPEPKQYTIEQLREEKIAVLVENEEQAKVLDIKSWCIESAPYWSISKISRIETDVWSCCDEMFWLNKYFTIINFSQIILPEAKQVKSTITDGNITAWAIVNDHYKQTTIEPIKVIQDWKLSFCLGNVIKYIGRADHKGNKLADLEKAADYLRMEIESMKR